MSAFDDPDFNSDAKALRLLTDRDERAMWDEPSETMSEALATAQVYAILAVAEAVDRLTDRLEHEFTRRAL